MTQNMKTTLIPQIDLAAQHAAIRDEIQAAVARVIDSGHYILGPEVAAFETEFAAWTATQHAVGVSSGTAALHLALRAAGIGAGDEVITSPFTFVASAAAILYAGARPVFADINPRTYAMDVSLARAAVTQRTRAIMPVHLYGHPADMDAIMTLAAEHRLTVIEDAAQAHGALVGTRHAGSFGAFGCFSFYPTKNLGACGEGGLIVTDDAGHARTLRMLRDWGQEEKGRHDIRGFNSRLHAIQAAILRVKLRHLDAWNEERRRHAAAYGRRLERLGIVPPMEARGMRHVWHAYTIRVPKRDAVRRALLDQGIQTGVHYPRPVHLQPAYRDLGYPPGAFPEAERAAKEVISLPLHPALADEDRERVCDVLEKALDSGITP